MLWWTASRPRVPPVVPEGELDVDRVVELQRSPTASASAVEFVALGWRAAGRRSQHAGVLSGAQADHHLEAGQAVGCAAGPACSGQFRAPGRRASRGSPLLLKAGDRISARQPTLLRRIELGAAVGRVDVHQHQAGLGGGELGQRPFHVFCDQMPMRSPFSVPRRISPQARPTRRPSAAQLGGQADVLVAHHQRLPPGGGRRPSSKKRPMVWPIRVDPPMDVTRLPAFAPLLVVKGFAARLRGLDVAGKFPSVGAAGWRLGSKSTSSAPSLTDRPPEAETLHQCRRPAR